jgi:hypothetical protein
MAVLFWLVFFPASGFARYWVVQRVERRPQPLQSNEPLQLIGGIALFCLLVSGFLLLNLGGHWLRVFLFLAGGIAYDLTLRWYFFEREVYRLRKRSRCSHRAAVRTVRSWSGYRAITDFLPAGLRYRWPLLHGAQKTGLTGADVDPYDAS